MKDRNHKNKPDPLDPIDELKSESRFFNGSIEEAEEERELRSLLDKWQAPSSLNSLDQRVFISFREQTERSPFWRRMLTSSVSLPAPVAAAFIIALVLGTMTLLRQRSAPAPQAPTIVERIKTIEVPVVQERVVERIVYRERRSALASQTRSLLAPQSMSLAMASGEDAQSYFTDTNLAGFQPNAEMNFKVIKKADKNEK
jgi:hypothetical protein